jgi:O-antigen/teichoic acid export membrane protein
MSRLKNFSRNLVASYLQLAVNVLYTLVSIRLVWNWLPLPEAQLGIWALLGQMIAYIVLLDLGMTAAVSRLLVDHKDDRANGRYGAMIRTAFLVSFAQSVFILLLTLLGAPLLAWAMQHKIPPDQVSLFITLLRLQGLITAFAFAFRPLNLMLYANQRMDIQSLWDITNLVASLGLLALFLVKGCGIFSYLYANACMVGLGPVFLYWQCRRLGFVPRAGEWGRTSWAFFKEMFAYAKDIFLLNLGFQLQMASQTIVVFNALGATEAAMWAVGSKMFSLAEPLMCRPYGASLPGLFEMHARGEKTRLLHRYRDIVLFTASLGAFLAAGFVLCNDLFVRLWTSGKTAWSPLNDVLLGLWLFVLSLQTTHRTFVNVTKQIAGMRYMLFLEGLTFLVVGLFTGSHWGIPGMVATSIACTLAFTWQYGVRRTGRYFDLTFQEVAVAWVRPSLRLAGLLAIFVLGIWLLTGGLPPLARLAVHGAFGLFGGGWLLLRFGFPSHLLAEARHRLPAPAARLLGWIVPQKN